MKKFRGLWLLFLLTALSVEAETYPQSGIDWDASTITVAFTEAHTEVPDFSCFGEITNPVTKTLTQVGYSDSNTSPEITDCFQQDGIYDVEMVLVDNASNSTTENFSFRIYPGDVAAAQSSLDFSQCYLDTPLANDTEECLGELMIKDQFGNPVTQIQNGKIYSADTGPGEDANQSLSFRDGISYDGVSLASTAPGSNNISFDLHADPEAEYTATTDLSFTGKAPSIAMVGSYLSKLQALDLVFDFDFPTITAEGIVGGGTTSIQLTAAPLFKHLFAMTPGPDPLNFVWGVQRAVDIDLTALGVGGEVPSARNGYLTNPLPSEQSFYDNTLGSAIVLDNLLGTSVASYNTTIGAEGSVEDPKTIGIGTKVSYQVGGEWVSYPAGGIGDPADINWGAPEAEVLGAIGFGTDVANARMIGLDIEGGIFASGVKSLFEQGSNNKTFTLGEVTAQDIREDIFRNTFNLTRSLTPQDGTSTPILFSSLVFNTNGVAFVEGDVKIVGNTTAPSGENTLVIQNGNLIVQGNLTYGNSLVDSFGVILINDDIDNRNKGNILVHSAVQKIVGSYYAEGGLMGTGATVNPTLSDNANAIANNGDTENQLILEGSILSHNTIGGSIQNASGHYATPWEVGASVSHADALNYDLHFIRRYNGTGLPHCGPDGVSACDDNPNAFVIRIDRKASEIPPPGFENISAWAK